MAQSKRSVAVPGTSHPAPKVDDYAEASYESEVESYTTSLMTGAADYRYRHGRRYHAYKEEKGYVYPNDEQENDRLDMTHEMFKRAMDEKLFFAPVKSPKRILDLGCGTGIWALDVAEQFQEAEVIGNDISPIQSRWVPPNVRFEIDDIEAQWAFINKFDFIHCRGLSSAIKDWPKLVRQSYEFTAPGGSVEFVDYDVRWCTPDNSLREGSPIHQLITQFIKSSHDKGTEPNPGLYLEKWMKDAGFNDISVTKMPMPIGTWAADQKLKEVGAWNYAQIIDNLEGFFLYLFTTELGWSKDEVLLMCEKARAQLKDPKVHCMWFLYIVHGTKPE